MRRPGSRSRLSARRTSNLGTSGMPVPCYCSGQQCNKRRRQSQPGARGRPSLHAAEKSIQRTLQMRLSGSLLFWEWVWALPRFRLRDLVQILTFQFAALNTAQGNTAQRGPEAACTTIRETEPLR
ncbi:hypothetical protein BU16DRAFT_196828 [Lophium mytilinum]|uniref:Uncharacterized protein n=1 Tax=Lophium mytilinum TaxID=390894 RepID=A0A6A6RC83_9PEZI|nr:hypothetical protein BU16DRAFT_196828 [Lophium mytilinum]